MHTEWLVILSVLIAGLLVLLGLKTLLFLIRRKMQSVIDSTFPAQDIVLSSTSANFFGQISSGMYQIRGNGALVLTRQHLIFIRAWPRREYKVEVDAIRDVSLPRMFNGKTVFVPLLCVQFQADGADDAMAWSIPDAKHWQQIITSMMPPSRTE